MRRIAIIDLGSNSARLIIMEIAENGGYKLVKQIKEMVRLCEGMGEERTLKPLAIERTLEALKQFDEVIHNYKIKEIYAYATAAVRSATNQEVFLSKVPFAFQVLSGEQEAYYDYLGVVNTVQIDDGIAIDTGGGSTELIYIKDRQMVEAVSIPFGAVNLTERFENQSFTAMILEVKKTLQSIPWLKKAQGLPIIGLGGSIRTLYKMHIKKDDQIATPLHHYQMPCVVVEKLFEDLSQATTAQRIKMPGIDKERADIIVAGLAPLYCIMQMIDSKKLIISGNGLREGVFYEKMLLPAHPVVCDVREHAVENMMRKFYVNASHARHIEKLVLSLYQGFMPMLLTTEALKPLLSTAALLHDVGMHVDYYEHHRHGFYLMMNARINGLSQKDTVICALLIGQHRFSEFKIEWQRYKQMLDSNSLLLVRQLSILFKIAEDLDGQEMQTVGNVQVTHGSKTIRIILKDCDAQMRNRLAIAKWQKEVRKYFNRSLIVEMS